MRFYILAADAVTVCVNVLHNGVTRLPFRWRPTDVRAQVFSVFSLGIYLAFASLHFFVSTHC